MKLAIVVGHTLKSPGAYSPFLKATERAWNGDLAQRIKALAPDIEVFLRDGHGVAGAYAAAQAWGCDGVVELHFNSHSDPEANGTETLWARPASKPLAEAVQRHMVGALGLRDRGAKQPWQGRGAASLTALPLPSAIVEPFFGSNMADCVVAATRKDALAEAILSGAREALL